MSVTRHRVRLSRVLSRLGFVGLYGSFFVGMWNPLTHGLHPAWILLVYALWFVPWVASFLVWFHRGARPGRLAIDAEGAWVETGASRRHVARADLASACVIPGQPPAVELTLRSGDVFTVEVENPWDADAAVAGLGFGTGGRRQTILLASRKRRFLHLPIAFGAYQATTILSMPVMALAMFGAVDITYVMPVLFAAIGLLLPIVYRALKRRAKPAEVEVGDDGIAVTVGTKRVLHPRWTIFSANVVPSSTSLLVSTSTGNVVVSGALLDATKSAAVAHALAARWSTAPAVPARATAFAREGHSIAQWQGDLRLRIADGGYRDAGGITTEDAEAVLKSPASPADARIGAALALAAAGQHVRIAASAAPVTDDRLRVALESIAEGRDEPAKLEAVFRQGR